MVNQKPREGGAAAVETTTDAADAITTTTTTLQPKVNTERLEHAMRTKTRSLFSAPIEDGKNARFLAINHEIIPCDPAKLRRPGKPMAVAFTILRPLSPGFSSVPYKQGASTQEEHRKKTSDLIYKRHAGGERQPVMQMWSFKKAGIPADRGVRVDGTTWALEAGNTVLLWLREDSMLKSIQDRSNGKVGPYSEFIVPGNMSQIDALSLCEISIRSKNDDKCTDGKGIAISSVKPVSFSLHSCLADLAFLSPSLAEARERQMVHVEGNPAVRLELETKDVPFWASVRREATLDDSFASSSMQYVRLCGFSNDTNVPEVDIPVDILFRYTNTDRVDWACALLDMAITSGSLSVIVFSSEYWRKNGECGFRAIPIVDVEKLLSAVTPAAVARAPVVRLRIDGTPCAVLENPGHIVRLEGGEYTPEILVGLTPEAVHSGSAPLCADFALTGRKTELAVGFAVAFNLKPLPSNADLPAIPLVWRGYFNASPLSSILPTDLLVGGSGSKRRRFQTMDE